MGSPGHEEGPTSGEGHGGLQDEDATLKLWNECKKLRLHLARPELGLDGTKDVSERVIGKCKVRYQMRRGYKSIGGMKNGIALTQWLYGVEFDLAKEMMATYALRRGAGKDAVNSPTMRGTVTPAPPGCMGAAPLVLC